MLWCFGLTSSLSWLECEVTSGGVGVYESFGHFLIDVVALFFFLYICNSKLWLVRVEIFLLVSVSFNGVEQDPYNVKFSTQSNCDFKFETQLSNNFYI